MTTKKSTKKKPTSRKRAGRGQRRWRRRLLWGALGAFGALFLLFAVGYALADIPEPEDLQGAESVVVRDRDGDIIGRIHAGGDRVIVPLDEMPPLLREAVIATEDRRFYDHRGLSPLSMVRALFANLTARDTVQGGSTITQQYVKNAFLGAERTLWRKTREAVIAVKLERRWSKDEILEAYLNTIYLGRGTYGVEAAARTYFGVRARDLTLSQSALLAGMIQAPERYDPTDDAESARARRDAVLSFMVRDGAITQAHADRIKRTPIVARERRIGGRAPHYLEEVRRFLEDEIGPRALYGGGVTVTATLDREAQDAAEDAVADAYDLRRDPEAALVAIDPADGGVRAMVGARDYERRQLNLATRALRQPGSTFKTAVLAAAVDEGIPTTKRFRAPASVTIETDSSPWKVSNYDFADHGTLTIERATELSVNTVYAQLMDEVGPEVVAEIANRLGITQDLEPLPSLALGTEEVTVLDLTSMYATLAGRGVYVAPALVERVTDGDGEVIYERTVEDERAVEQDVADRVNVTLEGVIREGTGTGADIGRPAAGKTGTTESLRDAWFAGYTPDLAAVVWSGYPKPRPMTDVRGIRVTGGSFPAQIWSAFMERALADVPPKDFPTPEPQRKPTSSPTGSREPDGTSTPSPTETGPQPSEEPTGSPEPSKTKSPKPSPSPTGSGSGSPSPSPSDTQGGPGG